MRSEDKVGLVFRTASGGPIDPNNLCRWIAPKEQIEEDEPAEQEPVTRLYTTFNAAVGG
jgi:hypothetical protein